MKCKCEECGGEGVVPCPGCSGRGERDCDLGKLPLDKSMPGYKELAELKNDVIRVRRQAERLIALVPQRERVYRDQLRACISRIDSQAEKAAEAAKNRGGDE